MDDFLKWKNDYVLQCIYQKRHVIHRGNCVKPTFLTTDVYLVTKNYELTYESLKFFDNWSNINITPELVEKYMLKDEECCLGNKECKHKTTYKLLNISLESNPIFTIKKRFCEKTDFTSFSEFEKALALDKKTKKEYDEYISHINNVKAQRIANLFSKGK